MSPRLAFAATVILVLFAAQRAFAGDAWGAAFLGFVAGGWFITFVDEVWP